MNYLTCPVCKGILQQNERSYRCKKGHSFDLSASGYLHLLPSNKMNSKLPGDNKQMVSARRNFLQKGYYQPISDKLNQVISAELKGKKQPLVLDVGCGEGYYTSRLDAALKEQNPKAEVCGMDISKLAINAAAKSCKNVMWAVASSFDLPVADESCDVLVSMFAPICMEEFHRVLKKGGALVFAITSTRHLWELKEAIYDEPYENKKEEHQYDGFTFEQSHKVQSLFHLPCQEDIGNLFTMTPYYYKSSVQTAERVAALQELDCQLDVDILVYRKQ